MADATLIQGARELAAAKSGVAPGAAFSAGVQRAQANAAANAAAQNKSNIKAFDAHQKFANEFTLKGITGLIGNSKTLTEGDRENIATEMDFYRSIVNDGADMNDRARSQGNYDDITAAARLGERAKGYSVQLRDQVGVLEQTRAQYLALNLLKENGEFTEIAKLSGNIERMKQMDTLLTSDWSMKDGALTFADGTRLIDMKLPFTTEIGKEFMEYAGKETKAMSKFTQSQQPPSTVTAEIRNNITEYFEGEDGLNRLELLSSENYFKELNPGFAGINLDRNDPDEARAKAIDLTYNAILGGIKNDAVDDPSKPTTNENWRTTIDEAAVMGTYTMYKAPSGRNVVVLPAGKTYKGFKNSEPMLIIDVMDDTEGNPVYQMRNLDQGFAMTKNNNKL